MKREVLSAAGSGETTLVKLVLSGALKGSPGAQGPQGPPGLPVSQRGSG